jgi:hypothetical protein
MTDIGMRNENPNLVIPDEAKRSSGILHLAFSDQQEEIDSCIRKNDNFVFE